MPVMVCAGHMALGCPDSETRRGHHSDLRLLALASHGGRAVSNLGDRKGKERHRGSTFRRRRAAARRQTGGRPASDTGRVKGLPDRTLKSNGPIARAPVEWGHCLRRPAGVQEWGIGWRRTDCSLQSTHLDRDSEAPPEERLGRRRRGVSQWEYQVSACARAPQRRVAIRPLRVQPSQSSGPLRTRRSEAQVWR